MTARCEITDLDPVFCAHCTDQNKRRPPRAELVTGRTVEARYPGQCRGCGEPYARGALITRDEDTGGWLAECCDEQENPA